jgi:DNA ligase (NAD+)
LSPSDSEARRSGSTAPAKIAREAEKLRAELHRHSYLYYVEARPEISDAQFDRMWARLLELEREYPELVTGDSPTQRVGVEPQNKFQTIEHVAPMLSLDSTQSIDDVRRFHDRVCKALGAGIDPAYVLQPKLDGASIELVYESGVLVRAVTRGNGARGRGRHRERPHHPLRAAPAQDRRPAAPPCSRFAARS